MKIAIVVHGRFHAFDLAKALIARGHNVTVFTNYPKWVVKRFGLPRNCVRTFVLHGLVSKLAYRVRRRVPSFEPERWLHPMFGRWVSSRLAEERWDVIHGWSGVSEETLLRNPSSTLRMIMRGSAHIRTQDQILEQEEQRVGRRIDRPGPWIIAREEREYQLTDCVVVLSNFARESFCDQGFEDAKLRVLSLGASTKSFRPTPEVIEARCQRIIGGQPLSVLFTGNLSYQKGMWDAASILRRLGKDRCRFRFVGTPTPEVKELESSIAALAEFVPRQPQHRLPSWYAQSDLFLFPTIQDGFAVVLAQAQASGLPILTTTNCCGPDLIRDGETGWVLPIRDPDAFVERLIWCDTHRDELAAMVRNSYNSFRPRDWADVAADFESLCVLDLTMKRAGLAAIDG